MYDPIWFKNYYKLSQQNMYNRKQSEEMLIKTYGYQSCGAKHEENIFTKWYMNFLLFTKYNIDKRKAHFSSLINSGQLDRKTVMEMLAESPIYPKLGIESKVLKYPKRRHEDFAVDKWFGRISKVVKFFRKWKSMATIK